MPDLTGLTALDVAIGLAFLYFVLSTVCSAIQELLAGIFGWRAKNLEKAIAQLLDDPAKVREFWLQPRIQALAEPVVVKHGKGRRGDRKRAPLIEAAEGTGPLTTRTIAANGVTRETHHLRKPSYIPAHTFAMALFDTFVPNAAPAPGSDALALARHRAEALPPGLREAALDVIDEGRAELDARRIAVEKRFDAIMDRASGWYKRTAQKWLLGIALLVAAVGNVDSFQVANRLWKDDTLRAAVVQRADSRLQMEAEAGEAGAKPGTVDAVADSVDDVSELKLPVGWTHGNVPHGSTDTIIWGILGKILGILATAIALMLGAPFWFDVLGKFAKLRSTGNRIGTLKDHDRAAEDRDDPSGRRPSPAPSDEA